MKFEDLSEDKQLFVQVLGGLKMCYQNKSIYSVNSDNYVNTCQKLVDKGWALEVTPLYFEDTDKPNKDRAYQITIKGLQETTLLWVSDTSDTISDIT